ncbi:MAG: HPr family phosphocarrier protein [Verrucomicrobia bacterium]|nr:HPr family phosphocarrier protein [Verrucomicrobiota bacterium]
MMTHPLGMNSRHAGMLAGTARRFNADVMGKEGSQVVSGKSLLCVLTLCVCAGDSVTVTARGGDANEAIGAIAVLFESGSEEEPGHESMRIRFGRARDDK